MRVTAITKYFGLADAEDIMKFVRFCIVGALNTVVHFTIYLIFTRSLDYHYLLANTIAWFVAVCFSFTLNKFWTFKCYDKKAMPKQYLRFFLVSVIALGLYTILLYIFVGRLGFSDIIGLILAIGLVTFWNFFMNKFWTFTTSDDQDLN